ncbi:MAG: fatty acid desaturase [Longimicrobiaceae bacterium]
MIDFGLLAQAPWWVPVLFVLAVGHISNVCITLYLHRGKTHGGVEFHPVAAHFMRFWLWLTTGTNTREWVAVHRKHHAYSDREGDPHSPAVEGFWSIVLGGVFFYQKAIKDRELLEKYGKGCPDDWMENSVYTRHGGLGLLTMLAIDLLLFGPALGFLVWTAMIFWFPVLGNVVNGIGHALGYRNFGTKDHSRNIVPLGLIIAGEELHNNHHADPRSAKFKARWWEFDIGWVYIKLLALVKLAEVVYARSASVKEFTAQYYGQTKDAAAEYLEEKKLAAEVYYREKKQAAEQYYDEKKLAAERYYAEKKAAAEKLYAEKREQANFILEQAERTRDELAEKAGPRVARESR